MLYKSESWFDSGKRELKLGEGKKLKLGEGEKLKLGERDSQGAPHLSLIPSAVFFANATRLTEDGRTKIRSGTHCRGNSAHTCSITRLIIIFSLCCRM